MISTDMCNTGKAPGTGQLHKETNFVIVLLLPWATFFPETQTTAVGKTLLLAAVNSCRLDKTSYTGKCIAHEIPALEGVSFAITECLHLVVPARDVY